MRGTWKRRPPLSSYLLFAPAPHPLAPQESLFMDHICWLAGDTSLVGKDVWESLRTQESRAHSLAPVFWWLLDIWVHLLCEPFQGAQSLIRTPRTTHPEMLSSLLQPTPPGLHPLPAPTLSVSPLLESPFPCVASWVNKGRLLQPSPQCVS